MAYCIMIIRWHATCDHLFPTFFCSPPSRRDSMSGACFPGWGPGHWGRSWRPRRRLSKSKAHLAVARCEVQRRVASGGFSRKPVGRCGLPADEGAEADAPPGEGRTLWECWALYPVNRQTNDECFGLHIFKTVHIHKHIGAVSVHLFYNITFDEKICNTNHSFFNDDEASKDNVIN